MRSSRRRQLAEAERRQMQADQRAARAETETRRLRAALDILPVGVVVADEDGRILYRNPQGADLTGARGADILVAQAVGELLAQVRESGPLSSTLELHGPPPRTLVVSAQPIGAGAALGAVAVSEDISDRRQLEATRRDFVANVSHELRTPVGALSVLTEALAGEYDPETTRRLATHIAQESERLGRIIEDLLDLSRIEGEPAERETRVELDALLDAAVERVRPVAERHQVEIRMGAVGRSLAVVGDASQLVSAVANLLDNAVKYSEAGSSVDLEGGGTDRWIKVIVRDRGIGIPSKDLERIFERFYRVDRARSRQTGGTGLGLAIVRHVATNHGGDVRVESTEGMGSTFTLRLPAASS